MFVCVLRAHIGIYRRRSEQDIRHLTSLSTYCLQGLLLNLKLQETRLAGQEVLGVCLSLPLTQL